MLFRSQLGQVLPATLEAVRLAALMLAPTVEMLSEVGVDPAVLDPAEEAGLVVVRPQVVEFVHPVHASVVRVAIPSGARRIVEVGVREQA